MTVEDLIFVGLNGYAVALNRDTGEIVWSNDQMKSGYVTLLLDFDRLIVSTNGYIYCLDPLTGNIQWHNPLKGYGAGAPTSLVSVRGQTSQTVIEQAAAAAAAAAAIRMGRQLDAGRHFRPLEIWAAFHNNDFASHGGILKFLPPLLLGAFMPDSMKARVASLSPRQHQIVRLTSLGCTSHEIATVLGMSRVDGGKPSVPGQGTPRRQQSGRAHPDRDQIQNQPAR